MDNINETTDTDFILNGNTITFNSLILNVKEYFENLNYITYFFWGKEQIIENINSINNINFDPNKKYIIFFCVDYEWNINLPNNVIIFRASLLKSKQKKNEFIYPIFFVSDPKYTSFRILKLLEKNIRPRISFCGSINTYYKRVEWLNYLKNSNILDCNFIYRTEFRGGTVDDYINNLELSEFCFCPRGSGNFSIRFYECLYYGRIPVTINTDILLPFEKYINWTEISVIANTIEELPDKIFNFWQTNNIIIVQNKCKEICKEYFKLDNISKYLNEYIN